MTSPLLQQHASPSAFARSRWSLPSTPAVAPLPWRTPLTRSGVTPSIIRPQTVPLGLPPFRSALPFRLRCADSAQSGAATPFAPDVTALAEPRTAPSRFANGATDDAADPRLGVAVAPSAPRPHSAPFRSPDRHRLLDCPAHNVSRPKPIPARRDAVTRFRARQGGCSPSAADSPGQHAIRPPLAPVALNARRKLALPGLMLRGASMLAANNAARTTSAVRSQSSLTTQRPRAPVMRKALRSPPGTSPARVAGDPGWPSSRRGAGTATAFRLSRPTSCPASIVRVLSANPPRPAPPSGDLLSPARTTYLMPNMPSFGASPAPCQGTRPEAFLT